MLDLIKSELLKVRSTQVWIWMTLPAIALTGLSTIFPVARAVSDYHDALHAGVPKDSAAQLIDYYSIFTTSSGGGVALLVIGVLGLTTEFRHKTITPTLLATPARWSLLTGKAASYAVFSIFYALICIITNFAVALPWLSGEHLPISFDHGVPAGVLKAFISLVLTAVFGLGLGALVKNQAGAMVIGIIYFAIIDNILGSVPWVRRIIYKWTPGGALNAFTSNGHPPNYASDVHLLAPLVGGLLFVVWTAGLLVAGGYLSLNRDIS